MTGTEEKIREAARNVFRDKGFAATTTRDIAAKAGVNPALINYYFKGKKNLFNEIMNDTVAEFYKEIRNCLPDDGSDLAESLGHLLGRLMELYTDEPDMILFMLNEMRNRKALARKVAVKRKGIAGSVLERGLHPDAGDGFADAFIDLISLTLFPFVGKPIIQAVYGLDDEGFRKMMERRRKSIPQWIENAFGKGNAGNGSRLHLPANEENLPDGRPGCQDGAEDGAGNAGRGKDDE